MVLDFLGEVGEEVECWGVLGHLDDLEGVFFEVVGNEAKV